jgi:hypothetical protein
MKRILLISALSVFGCAHPCLSFAPCDFDRDGAVRLSDLGAQRAALNTANTLYDVDGDGFVLGADIVTCNEAYRRTQE